MGRVHGVIVLAALTAISCAKSDEIACLRGYALCGGICVRVADDRENCGGCGNACGGDDVCVAGSCVPDCRQSLHATITDPWDFAWDGLERPAATYTDARKACEGLGGRLPTVSELYRVSAVKSGAVGDAHKTNPIWSITPNDASNAYGVTLSSGGATYYGMSSSYHYRCVCPPARPAAFGEGACYGSPGGGCAALGGDPRFNFDAQDRPAVTKAGAIYECALAGGELPSAERLAAAVTGGLPNGTGASLHTGDDAGLYHTDSYCALWFWGFCLYWVPAVNNEYDALVSFTGTAAVFGEGAVQTQRPFRCFGPAAAGAVAASVANGFREPRGERVIDADPDLAVTTYTEALWDCFEKGGHLPDATELAAFAMQGLPAGANAGLRWTSDQEDGGYVAAFAWSGSAYWPIDPDLAPTTATTQGVPYVWGSSVSRLATSDATGLPYRCVYYAVDPTFVRPADGTCSGASCFEVSPATGGSSGRPRMWFDWANRGGGASDTYEVAVSTCAAAGARLPSARDYVEAIRSGLGNNGDAVLTSDLGRGLTARTVTWNGTINPTFMDTSTSAVALTATNVKYRCMWTNEIR